MKKIFFLIFLITISCTNNKIVKNHGVSALDLKVNKVQINKTNKNDIINIFGKPSTISTFDDNTWYYIQSEKINQSFLKLGKTKIKKNTILELNFNSNGIIENKKIYNLDNMNDLKISKSITNDNYNNRNYYKKLLNSLKQKIDSPKLNRKRK